MDPTDFEGGERRDRTPESEEGAAAAAAASPAPEAQPESAPPATPAVTPVPVLTEYIADAENVIFRADSAALLRAFPANHVDLVVTSPPYDDVRSYNGFVFDFAAFQPLAAELFRVMKPGKWARGLVGGFPPVLPPVTDPRGVWGAFPPRRCGGVGGG
jgi:hypothetical protein